MINCVYIHIPYCKKKCKYCSFCSFENFKYEDLYINALIEEIKFYYGNEPLKTIYFGGGTPYLLKEKNFEKILSLFNFSSSTEVTLELNPYSVTLEKLTNLKTFGFNRLSLGVQSFNNDILKSIGRLHSKKEIYQTIEYINNLNFDNFSIDLMYGLPNQTLKDWEDTLKEAIIINPSHISLYGLKIEPGSFFYKFPPKNLPSMDLQAPMYETAFEELKKEYIHYEFSNFAKNEKYFSKHNCAYWECKNYYGFGLSASGYIENKRYTNTFNLWQYMKNPTKKDYQILSKENLIEEEIFLGLRLIKGIDFNYINKKYDIDVYKYYKKEFDKFLDESLMKKTKNGVKLTTQGVLLSNEILCDFINIC